MKANVKNANCSNDDSDKNQQHHVFDAFDWKWERNKERKRERDAKKACNQRVKNQQTQENQKRTTKDAFKEQTHSSSFALICLLSAQLRLHQACNMTLKMKRTLPLLAQALELGLAWSRRARTQSQDGRHLSFGSVCSCCAVPPPSQKRSCGKWKISNARAALRQADKASTEAGEGRKLGLARIEEKILSATDLVKWSPKIGEPSFQNCANRR